MAEKLVKINLDTGAQTELRLDSNAQSLVSNGELVYFVTHYDLHLMTKYHLNSLGGDDIPVSHSEIAGSRISVNPLNNEIVVGSILDMHRYRIGSAQQVESLQVMDDLGGTWREFTISPDGQQLAVILSDNEDSVLDLDASNMNIANGAWETSPVELHSFNFSFSGAIFAASNGHDLMLFDPISHVQTSTLDIGDRCAVGADVVSGYIDDIHFTTDDKYVVSRNDCNSQNEDRMYIVFRPVP